MRPATLIAAALVVLSVWGLVAAPLAVRDGDGDPAVLWPAVILIVTLSLAVLVLARRTLAGSRRAMQVSIVLLVTSAIWLTFPGGNTTALATGVVIAAFLLVAAVQALAFGSRSPTN